jgi:hypothetical protein
MLGSLVYELIHYDGHQVQTNMGNAAAICVVEKVEVLVASPSSRKRRHWDISSGMME